MGCWSANDRGSLRKLTIESMRSSYSQSSFSQPLIILLPFVTTSNNSPKLESLNSLVIFSIHQNTQVLDLSLADHHSAFDLLLTSCKNDSVAADDRL